MIVDSSAIVAMYTNELGHEAFVAALDSTTRPPRMSAATYVECSIVLDRRQVDASQTRLDDLLTNFAIELAPFTAQHAQAARRAHRRFGRGSGHPAKLNLGDCFSYALAITEDEPLLFKGDDFTHTDVRCAVLD